MSGAKDLLYKGSMIKEVSQNAKHLGQMWNIPSLEEEGAKNEKNPGRAIGKAAAYTAGAYLGGLLGGAAGAGGEAAGSSAAAAGDADMAAVQAGMTADQAAQLAAAQPGPGLLGNAYSSWASDSPGAGVVAPGMQDAANMDTMLIHHGLLDSAGQDIPSTLARPTQFDGSNTMEAGMTDTGYTPSNLKYALKNANAENGTSLLQNLGNYGGQKYAEMQNGGLLNRFSSSGPAKRFAVQQGIKAMSPQQPPLPMSRPMGPRQEAPQQTMYGGGGMYGMDEETKRKLREAGYLV
jgi:hypothetical protein